MKTALILPNDGPRREISSPYPPQNLNICTDHTATDSHIPRLIDLSASLLFKFVHATLEEALVFNLRWALSQKISL